MQSRPESDPESDMDEPGFDRRSVVIGAAFAATAAIAEARQPRKNIDYLGKSKLEDVIPTTVGRWKFVSKSGLVVPPEDQMSRELYAQLITRVYTDGSGPPVMLLIAQSAGQTGVLQVHRPEVCYAAGGYQLSPLSKRDIPLLGKNVTVNQLTATTDGMSEQILYWTRIGDRLPHSWSQQRMAVAIDNLKGYIPDALLARASIVSNDKEVALATLSTFVSSLIDAMAPNRRNVLVV
jgi:EpsI family protein